MVAPCVQFNSNNTRLTKKRRRTNTRHFHCICGDHPTVRIACRTQREREREGKQREHKLEHHLCIKSIRADACTSCGEFYDSWKSVTQPERERGRRKKKLCNNDIASGGPDTSARLTHSNSNIIIVTTKTKTKQTTAERSNKIDCQAQYNKGALTNTISWGTVRSFSFSTRVDCTRHVVMRSVRRIYGCYVHT